MKRLKGIINHKLVKHNQNILIILINRTLQHIYLVQLIIDRYDIRERENAASLWAVRWSDNSLTEHIILYKAKVLGKDSLRKNITIIIE